MRPDTLIIKTVGLDDTVIDEMKKVPPLMDLTYRFYSFDSVSEMICDENSINRDAFAVSILNNQPFPKGAREGKYILCTPSPEKIDNNDLESLYDLWAGPLTMSTAVFYFKKLLQRIRQELKDSSEELEYQKRILEMARQDYLTGLATRWYLREYFESSKDEKNITCIYLDLDHFKEVNDTYGHQAGDRALAATAEMLQREFADGFSARLGGDEFMVILLRQNSILDVEKRVNKFLENLLDYYHGVPTMNNLSISAGIAQAGPEALKTIDQLIHESDRALYQAKNSGRACCRVYEPSMEDSVLPS